MAPRLHRLILWVFLLTGFAVFFASYIVAAPLYNPLGVVVLPILLAALLLSIRQVESSRGTAGGTTLERAITAIVDRFPLILTASFMFLSLDIVITSYATFLFGTAVEHNIAVRGLLRAGETLAWAGQQLSPVAVGGALFGLTASRSARAALSIYMVATLAYGIGTVLSDLFVVYTLGGFR